MARPKFEPLDGHRKLVKSLTALGIRHDEIARLVGITPKTLRKHFRNELDRGAVEANAKVMETLFRMATSGKNTAAAIFWAKARCGWREKPDEGEGQREVRQIVVQVEE